MVKQVFDYTTVKFKVSRFNPFASLKKLYFLTLGVKEYMSNNIGPRLYKENISWDVNTTTLFQWESMIDIEFYLSDQRIITDY